MPECGRTVRVSRPAAARFLLARQGLLRPERGPAEVLDGVRPWRDELGRPDGALEAVRRLGAVQLDPVAVVERNHHLVLATRVRNYRPDDLEELYARRAVFEYWANARCVLPAEAYPLYRWKMAENGAGDWRRTLAGPAAYVLARLAAEGPLASRAFESPDRVVGYWDLERPTTKATSQALEHLWEAGEVTVAGRNGGERTYALTATWLADRMDAPAPDPETAREAVTDRYVEAYGLADPGHFRFGWRRWPAAERRAFAARRVATGRWVWVELEGVRRRYVAPAAAADLLAACAAVEPAPEVAILPPLDNLLWSRERLADCFGFEYTWEVYVPPARRRFGAYAMPILEGDRMIGRLDPQLDRAEGRLVVHRLSLEPGVAADRGRRRRVADALERFAAFHGARAVEVRLAEPEGLASLLQGAPSRPAAGASSASRTRRAVPPPRV